MIVALLVIAFGVGCDGGSDATPGRPDASVVRDAARPLFDGGPPDRALSPTRDAAPPGTPPEEDCSSYPFRAETLLAERAGFGAGTTGGDPTMIYRVTHDRDDASAGSLRAALESAEPWWIVFDANFFFRLGSSIDVQSHKTVDGRGRHVIIDGEIDFAPGTEHVIFSDVAVQYPAGYITGEGDLFELRGHAGPDPESYDTHHFWFHHLELGRGGDGQIDIRGATHVTISWCHFLDHAQSMTHGSDTEGAGSPGMRVTYHHDWFERISRGSPKLEFGWGDFFNNYQDRWYEYGVAVQRSAQLLSEANVYDARPGETCGDRAFMPDCPDPNSPTGDADFIVSKVALTPDYDGDAPGFVRSVGDVRRAGALIVENLPELVFDRAEHYAAEIEPADDALIARLIAGTGPRRDYCR